MRFAFLAWLAVALPAWGQAPVDLTSQAGFQRTCARQVDAAAAKTDAERIAFAVCAGVELLRTGARAMQDGRVARVEGQQAVERIRALLEDALRRIRTARQALEGVKGAGPYLRIEPGTWAIDLDGEDRILIRINRIEVFGIKTYMQLYPGITPAQLFFRATTSGRSWRGQVIEAEARARQSSPTFVYQLNWPSPRNGGAFGAGSVTISVNLGTTSCGTGCFNIANGTVTIKNASNATLAEFVNASATRPGVIDSSKSRCSVEWT